MKTVRAVQNGGCQIADSSGRVGSLVAMTKVHAQEKDAVAKNQQDPDDASESVRIVLVVLHGYHGGVDKAQKSLDGSRDQTTHNSEKSPRQKRGLS